MFTLLVRTAQAQAVDIGQTFGPVKGSESFRTLGGLVNVLLPNILTLAGVITLIGVIVAGFNLMRHAGSGEGEKAAKDRGAFTAALIGLILIFGAYFLLQMTGVIVGYDFLNPGVNP